MKLINFLRRKEITKWDDLNQKTVPKLIYKYIA
jgi:hypothetical protein